MPSSPVVRPPRQSRSRKTLDRIVRAALEIIEEQGEEGATVQEIVRRSGASVGSFYHRFASKDDLLVYLEERVWEEAIERWEEVWEGSGDEGRPPPERSLEWAVATLVAAYRSDFRIRSALSPAVEGAEGGRGRGREFFDRVREDLRSAILTSWERIPHPDPELGAEVAFRLLLGGLRELEAHPLDAGGDGGGPEGGGRRLGDAELAAELTRAVVGYLAAGDPGFRGGGDAARGESGADVDPFEIWS